ncbi:isocitrate/isopropylmalate family dehydrogenase [Kitasatospora sp. NBC_00315]|uniref:isocitrate/isopropylmalate family dehydrogenase n=1 Tax=Kitasatospora sp. NBC_00315 TaxID=2975963 RepID=UPI0032507DEE
MNVHMVAIAGDGIGEEVMGVTTRILGRVSSVTVESAPAGYGHWQRTGSTIDEDLIDRVRQADGVLFGCTATPSPPPETYRSPILRLRRVLGLSVNIRHCRSAPGGPMDVVMLRDCSEGLYSESEHLVPDGATADYRVTREATARLARAASAIARRRKGEVTVVHKANVLRQSDGLFRQVALETVEAEGLAWNEALADAAGYHLVAEPGRYDVMMMTSQVGDILSDVGAAVAGGLGLVPSLSLGDGPPLAEPIHGSAPDIAGKGIADPTAMLLSAVMLLEHLGLTGPSTAIRGAVHAHLAARVPSSPPAGTDEVERDIMDRITL